MTTVKSNVFNAASKMYFPHDAFAHVGDDVDVSCAYAASIRGTYRRSDAIELLISTKNRLRSVKHYPVTGESVTSRAQQAKNNIC